MDLYMPGTVSWWESQCYYHALAYLGREGIIICRPAERYVCLGLHDDLEQEIDRNFCHEHGLPLLRRETGGGVVLLDSNQIFYQVVLSRENPIVPARRTDLFGRMLMPALRVYNSLGIEARLVPPADIKAGSRKCSGNAAGDIGQCVVYIGNLLLDFDHEIMSSVLKVPTPSFRAMLKKALRDHILTIADSIGTVKSQYLESSLAREFSALFGDLNRREIDAELKDTALSLRDRLTSEEWLCMPGHRSGLRSVKIAEGIHVKEIETGKMQTATVLVRERVGEAADTNPVEVTEYAVR